MDEEWEDDVWTISGGEDTVHASVNGKITDGDRLRIFMRPSDRCRSAILATTFYTHSKAPDISSLQSTPITIELYGGDIDATIDYVLPLFGQHMAWISLFNLPVPAMKKIFEIMNKESDVIQIILKNSDTLEAEKYFDIPTNAWSLEGSMEALDRAENLCLRIAADENELTPTA